MKNKKNTLFMVGLLIAVIGLGIGYAISTQDLTIEGTATAQESASSFSVKFKTASPTTAVTTEDEDGGVLTSVKAELTGNTTAKMDVTLTDLNDNVTATFVVENASQKGLAAQILKDNVKIYKHGTTEPYASSYFDVTTSVVDTTIPSVEDNTYEFTVNVKLIKAYVGTTNDSITETFDIVLEEIEAIQE